MASTPMSPDDLPLFDLSTHELYSLAHGLIESDVDHEFCHRLFMELVKWHEKQEDRKVGRRGRVRRGVETFSVSPGLLNHRPSKNRCENMKLYILVMSPPIQRNLLISR